MAVTIKQKRKVGIANTISGFTKKRMVDSMKKLTFIRRRVIPQYGQGYKKN
jgi:hypothetical protein